MPSGNTLHGGREFSVRRERRRAPRDERYTSRDRITVARNSGELMSKNVARRFARRALSRRAGARASWLRPIRSHENVTIEGTVTGIDFVNPHAYLYFDATGADGKVTKMRCEMRAATVLRRSGWSPEMFTPGKHVAVSGNPHRDDPASCYIETLTLGEREARALPAADDGDASADDSPRAARERRAEHLRRLGAGAILDRATAERAAAASCRRAWSPAFESGQLAVADVPDAGWGASPVRSRRRARRRPTRCARDRRKRMSAPAARSRASCSTGCSTARSIASRRPTTPSRSSTAVASSGPCT